MNNEEKKLLKIFIEKCQKYDETVEIKGVSVGEEARILDTVIKALNLIEKQQEELNKEKEKNNLLEQEREYLNCIIESDEDNYISKDKIREKIEEINNENLNYSEDEYYLENEQKGYAIDKLKELLEENE